MNEDLDPLFAELSDAGHTNWVDLLRRSVAEIMDPSRHGHIHQWRQAIRDLPELQATRKNFIAPAVSFDGTYSVEQQQQLELTLRTFHPWRKGPFEIFGIRLDAEWRSDLKWQRVAPHVDLQGKDVLDVGCGNGYYGWRMLGAGAKRVIGLEPYTLYIMQHAVFRNYARTEPTFVIPASAKVLSCCPPLFDVAFSMGVFYHCKDPVGHLESLCRAISPGGTFVLETIVIDGGSDSCLIPEHRYAKMRNVWLLPSSLMLCRFLTRVGFKQVDVIYETRTTPAEQRATEWMTFESLANFLDPNDPSKTLEGYPAPKRAIVVATK